MKLLSLFFTLVLGFSYAQSSSEDQETSSPQSVVPTFNSHSNRPQSLESALSDVFKPNLVKSKVIQNKENKENKENQDKENKDQKEQEKQQPQSQPSKLSQKQAEQLLNALKEEEKKLQEKMKKEKGVPVKMSKDW